MSKLLAEIDMEDSYVISVYEDEVVVTGCDCADSLGDYVEIRKLYHALGDLLMIQGFK